MEHFNKPTIFKEVESMVKHQPIKKKYQVLIVLWAKGFIQHLGKHSPYPVQIEGGLKKQVTKRGARRKKLILNI